MELNPIYGKAGEFRLLQNAHCDALMNDCGHDHHSKCYCKEDQGAGYTYDDEYGECAFCHGEFDPGQVICADKHNQLRVCPNPVLKRGIVKQTARIENWRLFDGGLIGTISGHPRQHEFESQTQVTSAIVRMDEEVCETRNTIYTLGKKA